ncbi:type 1 glutamine amidotransferase domain-containing protein [Deinococcus sp. JMULE3]|uniref:type 1 glutamine amidotransferase domain-containing protein n=1 Tax=Deinococcus sp. JMULE3 TaxID=2518341 RepID=UPI001576F6F5|nr:type 1 glutamine amidotransferase domain-containing protein [Deinococcus sp. JMULE3]NTY02389.1 type 1 glutamine amidotransferase domain-containing protein [Deinococcus sp. JMULE3]
MSRNVLFVLTSHNDLGGVRPTGFYLSELAHPYHVFTRAGFDADFISVQGGQPPMDGADPSDPEQKAVLDDAALMARLSATRRAADVNADDYDLIFYVGGHGTMWDFPDDQDLASLASRIYERGGMVAAVCHGPAGLVNIRLSDGQYLVSGKRVAAFTNDEERAVNLSDVVPFHLETRLIERGAHHTKGSNFEPHVEIDGRLATGQNPASARPLAEAIVPILNDLPR